MPKCFSIKISVFLHFYLQSQYKYIKSIFEKKTITGSKNGVFQKLKKYMYKINKKYFFFKSYYL